ncbi:Molybdopterin-guanine dinucleotide biosynthesis protein A [Syntrophobotulus glycolicus DSM 8271]|uniref:Probable molybdenum cofactor guanylyltransferase n=1 Tax=Syntrophobotulus glycolicus (strain DSM 8271 / FlGlyR) TaxID=645991 RepID=F0SX93_SYNGF|nr:molybdenum cofactor guanylyltransferase [Syntrophobotulus glycolicus]ADY56953.1 Molybdopterin-guanine dinucleotide biosynthesis protein A [Syntrophobotulus glycolicus DSM 8271]
MNRIEDDWDKSETKLQMTGLLLVGGNSSRMGRDKAFLEIRGIPVLKKSLKVLSGVFAEVLISARDGEMYEEFGFKVVKDLFPGKGPLSGIYSGLQASNYNYVFAAACDMPFLSPEAIIKLAGETEDYDLVMPYASGRLHPLHAFYHQRLQGTAFKHLREGRLSLSALAGESNTKIFRFEEYAGSLTNVNTPEEWNEIRNHMERMKEDEEN